MAKERLSNGENGRVKPLKRDGGGRFATGNAGGPGRPPGTVAAWRAAMAESVTRDDIRAVALVLVQQAKAGAPWAIRELLDRCLGRPMQAVELVDTDAPRIIRMPLPGPPETKGDEHGETDKLAGVSKVKT